MKFVVRVAVMSVAVWLADLLLEGMAVTQVTETWQQVAVYALVGFVLTLAHQVIKPLVVVLTFLLYILTLGLFGIVVNALMLLLTSWVTGFFGWGLTVDAFWPTAVFGAVIISIASALLSAILPDGERRRS